MLVIRSMGQYLCHGSIDTMSRTLCKRFTILHSSKQTINFCDAHAQIPTSCMYMYLIFIYLQTLRVSEFFIQYMYKITVKILLINRIYSMLILIMIINNHICSVSSQIGIYLYFLRKRTDSNFRVFPEQYSTTLKQSNDYS